MSIADILGSIGVGILLVAFVLNLLKRIKTAGFIYSLLNLLGAALSCWASLLIHYLPFVVLEAVWTMVSLAGMMGWIPKNGLSKKGSIADAGRV
jgi:hypothetical protein